jgi:hypothetical protein
VSALLDRAGNFGVLAAYRPAVVAVQQYFAHRAAEVNRPGIPGDSKL